MSEPEPIGSKTPDEDEFMRRVKKWWRADRDHSADWRTEAQEDFDFVAGGQWSEEDKQVLKEQARPEITFNRIGPVIESVVGMEIGNRHEVEFIPRTQGDVQANEVLTAAAEWMRDRAEAEYEETGSFRNAVICGMGWVESRVDYDESPEGEFVAESIDPLEMWWDCNARKSNLTDARRMWRVKKYPLAEAEELFPDYDPAELHAAWAANAKEEDGKEPHNADPEFYYQGDSEPGKTEPKEVTIVHLQWWEREKFVRTFVPDETGGGAEEDLTNEEWKTLSKRFKDAGQPVPPNVPVTKRRYKQAFIGANVLGEINDSGAGNAFTWQCITGALDHNKGTFYGLVRGMKDPQRWANKWLSQALHILNKNAKGGIMAEKGAFFEDDHKGEKTWASPEAITWLKPGAMDAASPKYAPKPAPVWPNGIDRLMEFAVSSIRDVSGVNLELMGLADRDQAGVLERQRKQAGMTILARLFDSLRRFRHSQGKVMLYYIQNYLSDDRLVRIVGKEGERYVPLTREAGTVEYDVIVSDSATSPNQKEEVFSVMMQMQNVLKGVVTPDMLVALLEYSPLPSSVVEKVREAYEQQRDAQAQAQDEERQLAKEAHTAEIGEKIAGAAVDRADIDKTQAETLKILMEMKLQLEQMRQAMTSPQALPQPARGNGGRSQAIAS